MSTNTLADLRILIVDDVASARRVIKKQLEKLGCTHVVEAESGMAALTALAKEPCSLVVSDWNMPNLGGIELLSNMRKDENFKNIPFIMITSTASPEHIVKAASAGVTDFIVKPFSTETLGHKIAAIAERTQNLNRP